MESCRKNLSLDDRNKEVSFTFIGGVGSIHSINVLEPTVVVGEITVAI